MIGGKVTPQDTEHPLIVRAKKSLLGTDENTTLEEVNNISSNNSKQPTFELHSFFLGGINLKLKKY